jgi:uncharacterized RDD family membrane protein YckC
MFEEYTIDQSDRKAPERVGFGIRFLAFLIDSVIIIVLLPITAYLLSMTHFAGFLADKGMELLRVDENALEMIEKAMGEYFQFYLIFVGLLTTFSFMYSLIEGFFGASPGKMILGLKVANADGSHGDINLYMKRWALKNASAVLMIINLLLKSPIIEVIAMLFNLVISVGYFFALSENKQALHDLIAKSAVYKKKKIIR